MSEFIENIAVKGFRGFKELRVSGFGKVNLVTGKNNAGKSSLLEAVRILVTGGALDTLQAILNYREETNEAGEARRELVGLDFGPYRSLFTGFPDLSARSASFSIQATGLLPPSQSSLLATARWAVQQEDPERGTVRYRVVEDLFGDAPGVPALELAVGERRRVVPLYRRGLVRRPLGLSLGDSGQAPVRCVYLDPFSSRATGQLGVLWDAVALTDAQDEVLKALQLISPDIEGISMIGSDGPRLLARTAIVKSRQFDSPVPLRTFGDGVNRLFGIVLSLCNARNGVLLIDEFENGLHYSVQASIWATIFRLASEFNVQVFATTHSRDCVQAFQEAATESPQDGLLLRLTRQADTVAATVFDERELAIATRNDIEVR